jgi:hypothetical protein
LWPTKRTSRLRRARNEPGTHRAIAVKSWHRIALPLCEKALCLLKMGRQGDLHWSEDKHAALRRKMLDQANGDPELAI